MRKRKPLSTFLTLVGIHPRFPSLETKKIQTSDSLNFAPWEVSTSCKEKSFSSSLLNPKRLGEIPVFHLRGHRDLREKRGERKSMFSEVHLAYNDIKQGDIEFPGTKTDEAHVPVLAAVQNTPVNDNIHAYPTSFHLIRNLL